MCISIFIKSAQSPLECGDFWYPVLMFEDLHCIVKIAGRYILQQKLWNHLYKFHVWYKAPFHHAHDKELAIFVYMHLKKYGIHQLIV